MKNQETLTKKIFLQQVLDEANHLRKNATDEEKGKLDFQNLHTTNPQRCVYGQMTGDCNSERAKELYRKSFPTHMFNDSFIEFLEVLDGLDEEEEFTPIEVYITLYGSKNKQLLQYIKGEIDNFKP